MKYKVITPVATEPLTLAEVKAHLRLESVNYADDVSTAQLLVPASRAANTYTSAGVLVLGKTVLVNLNAGLSQAGSTLNVHVEDSDDNVNWADWSTAYAQITAANDNTLYETAYTGSKAYIRVVAVVAVAACEFSVEAVIDSADSSEDALLSAWISAAREYGEDYTSHAFATQTREYYRNTFPVLDLLEWPFRPLTSITSVTYKDSAGAVTTMTANTDYIVDTDTEPGGIYLPYSVDWPVFTEWPQNAVAIKGVCGYTAATLPKQFKQALLMHVGYFYKFRDCEIPEKEMTCINRLYGMRREVLL